MASTSRRRSLAALLTAAIAVPLAFAAAPAHSTAEFEFTRIHGVDRYDTAAEIARQSFPAGATTAVLATGEAFPDALAGSFIAGKLKAPILLVTKESVPATTKDALDDLGVDDIVLLGGEAAISKTVADALDGSYGDVVRLFGDNRYATAEAIANAMGDGGSSIGTIDEQRAAIVALGENFADALAAGPIAYAEGIPVVLTQTSTLPADSQDALVGLDIARVLIVGGPAAVSEAVKSQIENLGISTVRVSGSDRFETAAKIADYAIEQFAFDDTHVNLARGIDTQRPGQGYADALAGAPHAAKEFAPILLTDSPQLSAATGKWLNDHSDTLTDGHIFGGLAAISSTTAAAAQEAARNVGGEVVRVDKTNNRYTYVPEGSKDLVTVTYIVSGENADGFSINRQAATADAFEAEIDPGDRIRVQHGTPLRHELTAVPDSSITNRMIGNVDTDPGTFDYINEVSGDAIRARVDYTVDNATYVVGTTSVDASTFSSHLNEGDVVAITENGLKFTLTQASINETHGTANTITVSRSTGSSEVSSVRFRIGPFGDDPVAAPPTDGVQPDNGADTFFFAGGSPDVLLRRTAQGGTEPMTLNQFGAELSNGDEVTYSRSGGVETFVLANKPPATVRGTLASITADSDGVPVTSPSNDGGRMTINVDDGTQQTFSYGSNGTFIVDGTLSTEAQFEASATNGDLISFRAADQPSGQTQRIELTNQ